MDDAWFGYTVALTTVLCVHAWVDAICTVATLFPHLRWESSAAVYSSLFQHSITREDPLACRLLIYTVAAMGLVRLVSVCIPYDPALLLLVAIMYVLEALICIYEMDTSRMADKTVASRAACSAIVMSAAVLVQAALCFLLA